MLIERSAPEQWRGFSLIEVVVGLAILALVLAVLTPTIMPRLRSGQVAAIESQLDNLRVAIQAYRKDVRRYPRRLFQLTHALVPGDLDVCASPVSGGNRGRWNGPYIMRVIDGDFPVGDGVVRDTLLRVPANTAGGPIGQLQIVVTGVDSLVAGEIERQTDGNVDFANGSVLWNSAGGGTLRLQVPISGC